MFNGDFLYCLVLFHILINGCNGLIYHLNVTEYKRMPPLFSLDEYEACLSEDQSPYCVLRLDLSATPGNELMRIIQEYSAVTTKHYNHTYIDKGVCVKKTCQKYIINTLRKKEDLRSALGACMNDTIFKQYGLEAKLSVVYYCNEYNDDIEIDALDWAMAGLFALIILLNLVATSYDYVVFRFGKKVNEKGRKLITSFSVVRNYRWLVSAEPDEGRIKRLRGLHGMRAIGCLVVIIAHVMWINSCGFTHNPHDFERAYETPHYQMIFNGMMWVQMFFIMSGFLLVYYLHLYSEKHTVNWLMFPKLMLWRLWRLTPALAMMMAFTTTWMRHLGSGPLWKFYVTNSVVADCRTYWWYHLLYISNYQPDDKKCAIQTWHISADVQLFVVGLLVFLSTQVRGRYVALSVLLLLGIAFPGLHVWLFDMDGVLLMTPEFYRTTQSDMFHYLHIFGHNNIVCFALGMVAGEIVYDLQKKQIELSKYKIVNMSGYLSTLAAFSEMFAGYVFYADSARASLPLRVVCSSMHRLAFGLLVTIGLSLMVLKVNNVIATILEWRGWVVHSRLSYSIYLLHINLVHIYLGSRTQLAQASFYYLMICYFGIVTVAVIISLPFFLMVEAPMNRLLKLLLQLSSIQGEVKPVLEDHTPGNGINTTHL